MPKMGLRPAFLRPSPKSVMLEAKAKSKQVAFEAKAKVMIFCS